MDGRQQSVVPCPHRPPVKSLSELFEISKIQCEWMELYAREHRYTMKKPIKQNHRLAVTCVRATETDYNKAVIVVDEIAEYFGIEEGRMKVRCNRTVNGVTLIRSSFPGENGSYQRTAQRLQRCSACPSSPGSLAHLPPQPDPG